MWNGKGKAVQQGRRISMKPNEVGLLGAALRVAWLIGLARVGGRINYSSIYDGTW